MIGDLSLYIKPQHEIVCYLNSVQALLPASSLAGWSWIIPVSMQEVCLFICKVRGLG